MKKYVYQTKIHVFQLDTIGHVNQAVYSQLYEEARWEMAFSNGVSLMDLHKMGELPVVLDLHIQFLKEIKLKQTVIIESTVKSFEGKMGVIYQEMKNDVGSVFSTCTCKFGLFSTRDRTLVEPTEFWLKMWQLSST